MDDNHSEEQPLIIDESIKEHLSGMIKWAKFLAILGFILSGLIALSALLGGSIFTSFAPQNTGAFIPLLGGGIFIIILYLAGALIYFVPCLYLYRFALHTQHALTNSNQEKLEEGLYHLKRFFRFVGILTVIYLVVFGLIILVTIFGGIMGGIIGGSTAF